MEENKKLEKYAQNLQESKLLVRNILILQSYLFKGVIIIYTNQILN